MYKKIKIDHGISQTPNKESFSQLNLKKDSILREIKEITEEDAVLPEENILRRGTLKRESHRNLFARGSFFASEIQGQMDPLR